MASLPSLRESSPARRRLRRSPDASGEFMSRSLIVLPEDTAQPFLTAIDSARSSIRIKMFVFSDPALLDAVIAAHRRGVHVRVMLNPARRNGEDDNAQTRKALADA